MTRITSKTDQFFSILTTALLMDGLTVTMTSTDNARKLVINKAEGSAQHMELSYDKIEQEERDPAMAALYLAGEIRRNINFSVVNNERIDELRRKILGAIDDEDLDPRIVISPKLNVSAAKPKAKPVAKKKAVKKVAKKVHTPPNKAKRDHAAIAAKAAATRKANASKKAKAAKKAVASADSALG